MEPDERVQLPPARGRRDAGAGARVRAHDGDLRARHGEGAPGRSSGARDAEGRRAHLVLRERGRQVPRRGVQDARVRRSVGWARARSVRRRGREAPALPLRRAGELARPHRGAAGEQRRAHRDRDARRRALEAGARARGAVAGVERGARAPASVGPAVEPAHAADPRVRDGPPRLRGCARREPGHRCEGAVAHGRGVGRGAAGARRRRASRRGGERVHQGAPSSVERRAARADRARRAGRRRREPVHRDRGVAAHRAGDGRDPHRRSEGGARGGGARDGVAREARRGGGERARSRI